MVSFMAAFSISQSDYFWLAAQPPQDQTTASACPPQLLQGSEHGQQHFPYHQNSQPASIDHMSYIDFSNPGDIFHFDKSFADSNSQAATAAELGSSVTQQQGVLNKANTY